MNDVEKKFGESLRHHQVTPPPAVWDQLSANLAQKRKRTVVIYWRVAAAIVLLLLGAGTIITLLRSEPAKTVSQQQPPASNPEKFARALSDTNRTEKANASQGATPPSDASKSSPALAGSAPVASQDRRASKGSGPGNISTKPPRDSPTQVPNVALAPQPERPPVAPLSPIVPEAADQLTPTAAVHKVLPSAASQPDGLAPSEIAISDSPTIATGAHRRTITVIYKPGHRVAQPPVPDQNDGLLSKTLSFLEDVKKNGPTYSELRSAKSALIDNVFSRDPAKQQ